MNKLKKRLCLVRALQGDKTSNSPVCNSALDKESSFWRKNYMMLAVAQEPVHPLNKFNTTVLKSFNSWLVPEEAG